MDAPAEPKIEVKEEPPKQEETKATYKSFKKKYRKMRSKFDHKMRESNKMFKEEQRALENAKRLAQEVDQLMEILLDANSCPQIHGSNRIDLDIPSISSVPGLIMDYGEQASKLNFEGEQGKALQTEIQSLIEARKASHGAPGSAKSLSQMISATPSVVPPELIPDLQDATGQPPVSYLSQDRIDDYLYEIDTSLGTAGYPTMAPSVNGHPHTTPSDKELSVGNPNSVYNWLRQHEPKIFLQDGEGSEKSTGKPGALRGAGKRASIPAPMKPDQVEFVEEDGIGYETGLGGMPPTKSTKRKRDEDGGYRPKGGSSRPAKKKKQSSSESSRSKGKAKPSEASPSPAS